jgi:hypothetical protein
VSRKSVTRSVSRPAAVFAVAALVAGCDSGGGWCGLADGGRGSDLAMGSVVDVSAASASCVAGVEYRGRFYSAWSAELPVAKGRLLGEAVYPPCNGSGDCAGDGPDATGRPTRVWAMRGVDPGKVVVALREGTNRFEVFGSRNADPHNYFRFVDGIWHIRDGRPRGR